MQSEGEQTRTVTIRRGRVGAGRLGAGTFRRLDFYAPGLLGAWTFRRRDF